MNWIKENKIRIIIIAVAVVLLAGIGTVIALNTKQTKIDPADSNQSDVVINESSKEDVTTKKDDVIKESESTTEADKEEETTSKDDKNVEEETTPAAAEPTTPYVAPPTKPQAKPTTPQPTRPTDPATTAPVIHGKNGVILDTLYLNRVDGSKAKVPETLDELGGPDVGLEIWYDTKRHNMDVFGVGLVFNQSTKKDVEVYFGKSSCEKDTENGMVMQYNYKNTDIYVTFNFFKDTGKIRAISIDGDKGLDTY